MSSVLLHQLTPDDLAVELHLRLIHAWKSGDPSKPNSFFGFGTHWIDSEGKTVQGDSHKNFITFLQSRLQIGSVYKITDFVGKLIGGGEPGHIQRFNGVELRVSLWGDLGQVVDGAAHCLGEDSNPTIIAFVAFRITLFQGKVTANSTAASRVLLDPTDKRSTALRSFFESNKPWFYRACPRCFKAVAPNHDAFWCSDHESILASDVEYKYRLTLIVSDETTQASFILLGLTAEKILPIPAADLVRAYPNDFGSFPPAIKFMIGQTVEFEVQLPKFTHSNPFGDFKICNIFGLAIPRADLVSGLPQPTPLAPLCTSPRPHNTPLPGDPEYVPPIPSYISPLASPHSASETAVLPSVPQTTAQLQTETKQKNPSRPDRKPVTIRSPVAGKGPAPSQQYDFGPKYPALQATVEYIKQWKAAARVHVPLAKVKLEKLQSPSPTIPITPQSVLGDGCQTQLGCGKRKQTRKRLFDD
ncbi:hypothetical protein LINPERHAP2_LOCUS30638 [Linum perenne]